MIKSLGYEDVEIPAVVYATFIVTRLMWYMVLWQIGLETIKFDSYRVNVIYLLICKRCGKSELGPLKRSFNYYSVNTNRI